LKGSNKRRDEIGTDSDMSHEEQFTTLIERARQGDGDALGELVRQYESEVRLVARVRLGSALQPYVDSVDLVQSVHRSLFDGLQQNKFEIASPEKLIALALTIVRRKAAKHWRKLRRQQRLSGDALPTENTPHVIASLSASDSDPVALAAIRDQAECLLRDLEPADRELIDLRLMGFTTAEAATKLKLNADVLRVRLSRLRKRLNEKNMVDEWL
jgi:RNA polymerase sigma factor (sigma-70 family)